MSISKERETDPDQISARDDLFVLLEPSHNVCLLQLQFPEQRTMALVLQAAVRNQAARFLSGVEIVLPDAILGVTEALKKATNERAGVHCRWEHHH